MNYDPSLGGVSEERYTKGKLGMQHKDDAEVVNRLKTARGQIDGILKMIDEERYCIDIAKQIISVQSLLKKANMKILKNHMHHCVVSGIMEGKGDEKIDEILYILDKYLDRT